MPISISQFEKTVGKKHLNAQDKLVSILQKYYNIVLLENLVPVPQTYIGEIKDYSKKLAIPYRLDVYAIEPKHDGILYHIGIEVDGAVNHKKTVTQHIKDKKRTKDISKEYNLVIERFDTDELEGKGKQGFKVKGTMYYVTVRLLTDNEILERLHICQK